MTRRQTNDIHELYLASVQDPESDVKRISNIFSNHFNKLALTLREDFSGTFTISCSWVQSDKLRSAIAIDIDQKTLQYGKDNYLKNLSSDEQKRIKVLQSSAITKTEKVDITATFNFSYCLIHKRKVLLEYLKKVHQSLNNDGMLIMDIMGGSDSEIPEIQETEINGHPHITPFTFEFERKDFNPISRISNYAIHFKYPDKNEINNAFKYEFRMWSITEIRDLLEEAGYSKSIIYFEDDNGEYYQSEVEENTISWNAFIVGLK